MLSRAKKQQHSVAQFNSVQLNVLLEQLSLPKNCLRLTEDEM